MQIAVAPFPITKHGSTCGYRQDHWHISPDVDLPGIRERGGILCVRGRVSYWSGPEYPVKYTQQSETRTLCPACLKRLESIVRRWPVLYPKLRAGMENLATDGRVPRATWCDYTIPLDAAILPEVPSPALRRPRNDGEFSERYAAHFGAL